MATSTDILELGIMLVGLALVGSFAKIINKSVIPFYIVIGILLGPVVLGESNGIYVGQSAVVDSFIKVAAELGIIFLLFFLGLEFSIEKLIGNRAKITTAGIIDLLNLVLGVIVGYIIFQAFIPAFLLGGIVYISSSAIITKSLVDLGWIANDESEPILGVLVFEDIFIAVYLAIMSIFLVAGDISDVSQIAISLVILIGFFVILLSLVYFGRDLFQRFLETKSQEIFILRAVAVTVIIAGFALSIGVSEAVAAFFVGMGFSSTNHVDRLERLLSPLRDIFGAIFFFWIGLKTNPALVLDVAGILFVLVVLTSVSKLLLGFRIGKVFGLNRRKSIRVGLGLVPRGEFSLIISTLAGITTGIYATIQVTQTIPAIAVGYVLLMSIIGTLGMEYSKSFENFRLSDLLQSSRVESNPVN